MGSTLCIDQLRTYVECTRLVTLLKPLDVSKGMYCTAVLAMAALVMLHA